MSWYFVQPSALLALGEFPRGPGFYYSPWKLLAVVAVYLCWVRTCWWVNRDCLEWKLPTARWNPILLVCGIVGLSLAWAVPIFWASFVALVTLYLAPTLLYVATRNEIVPDDKRVLTPRHLRWVLRRTLGLSRRSAAEEEKGPIIPIRFIGKSGDNRKEDTARVRRAQDAEHYRTALELVHRAILGRATDIHLEPTDDEMAVRFRIDGILQAQPALERGAGDAVLNIFKVLADLDITEKRKPQDGSFSAEVQGPARHSAGKKSPFQSEGAMDLLEETPRIITRLVDFRVATAGSVSGEKMVMRILDRSHAIGDLGRLGMRDKMREQVRQIVTQPHGMFIVCGPTGAGKSTTLYACLSEIDRFQKNVITVENPVEYHIDNVTQIEINPKAGKTFASELRSILRQDPDVIYVGEVRDKETAEIACQAAQTGHMVFTTLHANDTPTAIQRLIDFGVAPATVASAISGILGQRLVRVLCPKCKVGYRPNPELLRRAHLPADRIKMFHRPPRDEERPARSDAAPAVCPHCGGTGYHGRTGVFELLIVGDRLRELIAEGAGPETLRQEAVRSGLISLQQDGMRVVIEGETSIEELLRVAR